MKLRKERFCFPFVVLFFKYLLVLSISFNSVHFFILTAAISIASTPVCIPRAPPVRQGRCLVDTNVTFPVISDSAQFWKSNQVSRDFLIVWFIIEIYCLKQQQEISINMLLRVFPDWTLYTHHLSINGLSVWRHQMFTNTTTRGHWSCREKSITGRCTT